MISLKDVLVTYALDILEKAKFGINTDDQVFVRTSAVGVFTPQGLTTDWVVTTMNVTSTATLLPASPLTTRNSVQIENLDLVETLYLGKTNSVVSGRGLGTTAGWEVAPGATWNMDITNNVPIYGIAESGKTILIKVSEVA